MSVVCIGASYSSNVNSLIEPVSDHMPFHKDVEKYIKHEVVDGDCHLNLLSYIEKVVWEDYG